LNLLNLFFLPKLPGKIIKGYKKRCSWSSWKVFEESKTFLSCHWTPFRYFPWKWMD